MGLLSRNTALAFKLQAARGTYEAPNSTTDLCSGLANLRVSIDGITVDDDSYTGSVFQNAPALAGKNFTASFDLKLDPPTAMPAANAWVPGRLLQAAKFTEIRNTTAIPAAPEALGVGSTTSAAKLGASASASDDAYRAYPLILSDNGTGFRRQLTAIRDYVGATKMAELMELLGGAPAANWQIPTFLQYARDVTSAQPPVLSAKFWLSGYRIDVYDIGITGLRLVLPTSNTQQALFPRVEFTIGGTITAWSDEATPSIPALGSVPLIKDADVWLNRVAVGTSDVTIDFGLQSDRPPNANQPDGADAPEITGGSATASLNMQKYLVADFDDLTLAEAQAYHPFWMQWGSAAWNMVQVTVPDARLNYGAPDLGGQFVTNRQDLFIDVLPSNLVITFPGA